MDRLNKFRNFIKRERIYVLLAVFILIVNLSILLTETGETAEELQMHKEEERLLKEEYSLTPAKLNLLIREKREVVLALNFLVMLIMTLFIIGLVLDFLLLFGSYRGLVFNRGPDLKVGWEAWDVCRVVILFIFFGYVLVVIESALAEASPLIEKKKYLRMMFNSSALDIFAIAVVLYIALVEYKEKLKSLGLSLANFFRNVFVGIAGYIATLPAIIGALLIVIWIAKITQYEPPIEPILKLFLKEKNAAFLLYSTFFATVFGPIFEEIFFRGFMYSALKKRIGIIWAIVVSAFLFSLLHTNIVGFLPIMVLGGLLAYLYERTGNLIPSITVHVIHNTGMMIFVLLMKELKI